VVLLDECERWIGDRSWDLEPEARGALRWIDVVDARWFIPAM
jgi:hypothetical protein